MVRCREDGNPECLPESICLDRSRQLLEHAMAQYERFHDPACGENPLPEAINALIQAAELSEDPLIPAKLAQLHALNGQFTHARKYLKAVYQRENVCGDAAVTMFKADALCQLRERQFDRAWHALKYAIAMEKPWRCGKMLLGLATIAFERQAQKPSYVHGLHGLWYTLWGSLAYVLTEPMRYQKPYGLLSLLKLCIPFLPPDRMLDYYQGLYRRYPGMEVLPAEIGYRYLQFEHYSEAEFWFLRAIDRHPLRDEGYQGLMELYRSTYNLDQLVDTLQRWLAVRPNNGDLLLALSQAVAQQAGENPDLWEAAVHYGKQALIFMTSAAGQAAAHTHLGNLYQASTETLDAAVMAYQAAIHLVPDRLETYVNLGTLYYDQEAFALAQHVFEQALALAPDNPKILCNLGYLTWMQGNISQAMTYYHQSIHYDPTYDIALNNLGVLYLDHVGHIDMAMALFDQTLRYNPQYALCYYNKGRAYSLLDRPVEAARHFLQAQELSLHGEDLDPQDLRDRIQCLFDQPSFGPEKDM